MARKKAIEEEVIVEDFTNLTEEEEILELEVDENALFPGGPTKDEAEEMKAREGGELYMTRIMDDFYLWRPLRRKEYKMIMGMENADSFYREEAICQKCVVWPKNIGMTIRQGKAGIASVLSEVISEESGFTRDVQSMKL